MPQAPLARPVLLGLLARLALRALPARRDPLVPLVPPALPVLPARKVLRVPLAPPALPALPVRKVLRVPLVPLALPVPPDLPTVCPPTAGCTAPRRRP